MSIEKDIKQQKPFKSPYQKLVVNILFTNNWMNSDHMNILKPFDLTAQQYNVLRILRGQYPNPITVNGIIDRMLDKMSNASRLVDKLLLKGLATRCDNKDDRRACDVRITDKGLEVLEEIDVLQESWESTFSNLTPEEAEALSNLLDKLRNSQ
ncbi:MULTISPECIES: MarR family winged helix-turn-helix transcriptional regulator [Emticicia]|uniref:MarR family winged helix-turn-helix transcriptional regulator n=1 Tax=Emticicia TaxID=312278 RepID=UPI000C75719F|nr:MULTISPECIES: MarR family transcriptional regulator [Emticicia]PLK42922.1 MarR family transcriptional regulator [Emticicia sp. TH156]UTA69939.1 MarR family transcriptional regulator [Emticicia sp. 21SJ11W-3]